MATANLVFFCGVDLLGMAPRTHERFRDVYFITNDHDRIRSMLEPYTPMIGTVEFKYLTQTASAVVYKKEVIDLDLAPAMVSQHLEAETRANLLTVQLLMLNLWIIKDNSVDLNSAWMAARLGGVTHMHTNVWSVRQTAADGQANPTDFTQLELRAARLMPISQASYLEPGNVTMLLSGALRFQRFLYFVQAGRATSDVAVKIVQYCSALESLLSTATAELSHQVAERVAILLATSVEDRITIYKIVKGAYSIRSKTVHGSAFKPRDIDGIRKSSVEIDEICRLLVSAYGDGESDLHKQLELSNDNLTEYFLRKLMG